MKPIWIWHSDASITHQIGSQRITPVTQSIGLRWDHGGWLWQFPVAVDVQGVEAQDGGDGTRTRLHIPNLTRTIVWLFTALTLLVTLMTIISLWQSRTRVRQKRTKGQP